jgi:hypothetical protein
VIKDSVATWELNCHWCHEEQEHIGGQSAALQLVAEACWVRLQGFFGLCWEESYTDFCQLNPYIYIHTYILMFILYVYINIYISYVHIYIYIIYIYIYHLLYKIGTTIVYLCKIYFTHVRTHTHI